MGFREDFAWGTTTSSYQIEGAVKGEGKGEHIWDVYTKEPGHVFEGHTGETACDHYHRYPEDVKMMWSRWMEKSTIQTELIFWHVTFMSWRERLRRLICEDISSGHWWIILNGQKDMLSVSGLCMWISEISRGFWRILHTGIEMWSGRMAIICKWFPEMLGSISELSGGKVMLLL